jgi:antirestriction protein ArdC
MSRPDARSGDTSRRDIYTTLADKIIAAIEANPGEPVMPWQRGGVLPTIPKNASTGNDYCGVNILSLWITGLERGYQSGQFATYKQWAALGAQVRKGEVAAPIVFFREFERTREPMADNVSDTERFRLARGYGVFAAEQVDGYALPPQVEEAAPIDRIAAADRYYAATGARIVIGGAHACYRPSTDTVHMPDAARFLDTDGRSRTENFYSCLGHEITHWCGAPSRLNRDLSGRFGDDQYAAEEVIAETGASFLAARLGIAHEPHPDHARYIAHWLKVMKADSRAMFTAAAKAQEAVAYLDGLQSEPARRAA